MSNDLLSAVTNVLSSAWTFLTSVCFPGTSVSFGAIFLGLAVIAFSLGLLGHVFGFHLSGSDGKAFIGFVQEGGNNKNIKVSNERKGDTH